MTLAFVCRFRMVDQPQHYEDKFHSIMAILDAKTLSWLNQTTCYLHQTNFNNKNLSVLFSSTLCNIIEALI